jgi:hypothetical protein
MIDCSAGDDPGPARLLSECVDSRVWIRADRCSGQNLVLCDDCEEWRWESEVYYNQAPADVQVGVHTDTRPVLNCVACYAKRLDITLKEARARYKAWFGIPVPGQAQPAFQRPVGARKAPEPKARPVGARKAPEPKARSSIAALAPADGGVWPQGNLGPPAVADAAATRGQPANSANVVDGAWHQGGWVPPEGAHVPEPWWVARRRGPVRFPDFEQVRGQFLHLGVLLEGAWNVKDAYNQLRPVTLTATVLGPGHSELHVWAGSRRWLENRVIAFGARQARVLWVGGRKPPKGKLRKGGGGDFPLPSFLEEWERHGLLFECPVNDWNRGEEWIHAALDWFFPLVVRAECASVYVCCQKGANRQALRAIMHRSAQAGFP